MNFLEAVKGVSHRPDCRSRFGIGASHPHLSAYVERCDCDRDERIAKGIEAMLESITGDWPLRWEDDAMAAFMGSAVVGVGEVAQPQRRSPTDPKPGKV